MWTCTGNSFKVRLVSVHRKVCRNPEPFIQSVKFKNNLGLVVAVSGGKQSVCSRATRSLQSRAASGPPAAGVGEMLVVHLQGWSTWRKSGRTAGEEL